MRLSRQGAGACAAHEACYLYGYPDPGTGGEPWTIGIGHTSAAGLPKVRRGDRITLARAFEIYAADMAKYEKGVMHVLTTYTFSKLRQHEFDALVSFHFNTGAIKTGSVDDKLNRGDVEGALRTWGQYINAGGRPMKGLITRRREEIELFRTGRYPARRLLIRDTPTGSGRYIDANAIPWRDETVVPQITAEIPPPKVVTSPVKVTQSAPAPRPWWRALLDLFWYR